jgi:UDP-N-acetylmuramate dehydrogenase
LEGINFAIGIPGTIGGALAMNAGTGSGTMQDVVQSVTLVTFDGRVWRVDKANLTFEYRKALWNSREISGQAIILETTLALQPGDPEKLKKEAQKLATFRKLHQPVGKACAGSFFKNPESGPPAGALIDRAGLKGKTVGGAMISEKHANFIINTGHATARDVLDLMNHVQETVYRRFGVGLSPEVRILGD